MIYRGIWTIMVMITVVMVAQAQAKVLDQQDQTVGGNATNATYVVKEGDWLSKIANRFQVKIETLTKLNDIPNPDFIYPGQKLIVPQGSSGQEERKEEKKNNGGKQKVLEREKEKVHIVQSGETVWGIAQEYDMDSDHLIKVNSLSRPSLIHPGDRLCIPEKATFQEKNDQDVFHWKRPGADPFTQNPRNSAHVKRALNLLGFSPDQASRIANEMRNATAQDSYLQKGDRLAGMVFGENSVEKPVICDFSGNVEAKVYTTPTLDQVGYALVVPKVCGNFSLLKKSAALSQVKVEPRPPPKPETRFPSRRGTKDIPPIHSRPDFTRNGGEDGIINSHKWEIYAGGGYSEPDHSSGYGQFSWGKARYRPLWGDLTNTVKIGMGGFGFGAMGTGEDDAYNHRWNKIAVGPNLKLIGKYWDADLDLGLGWMTAKGDEEKYESEQSDKIYYLSAYSSFYKRRNEGKQWFPEFNFGGEATIPYDTGHNHSWNGTQLQSDPWDNQNISMFYNQGIYDFKWSEFRITPEIRGDFGHNWGREANYYSGRPGLNFGYNEKDVFTLWGKHQEYLGSDADYKEVGVTVDITNIWRSSF